METKWGVNRRRMYPHALEQRGFAPGKTVMIIGREVLACRGHRGRQFRLYSTVACRGPDKAREFLDSVKVDNLVAQRHFQMNVLSEMMSSSDLIIQATPVGREGDAHELPWGSVRASLAFDMVYNQRNAVLKDAGKAGCQLSTAGKCFARSTCSKDLTVDSPSMMKETQRTIIQPRRTFYK